jgi:hypothetical protein
LEASQLLAKLLLLLLRQLRQKLLLNLLLRSAIPLAAERNAWGCFTRIVRAVSTAVCRAGTK